MFLFQPVKGGSLTPHFGFILFRKSSGPSMIKHQEELKASKAAATLSEESFREKLADLSESKRQARIGEFDGFDGIRWDSWNEEDDHFK